MPMTAPPPQPTDAEDFKRRRRGRNWAVLLALFAIGGLFYAITLVKISQGTLAF
jgi:hypothetical protein